MSTTCARCGAVIALCHIGETGSRSNPPSTPIWRWRAVQGVGGYIAYCQPDGGDRSVDGLHAPAGGEPQYIQSKRPDTLLGDSVRWDRRVTNRRGNYGPPKRGPWHIQSERTGHTVCGRDVTRFFTDMERLPAGEQPEGQLCSECVRWHAEDRHAPLGRMAKRNWR